MFDAEQRWHSAVAACFLGAGTVTGPNDDTLARESVGCDECAEVEPSLGESATGRAALPAAPTVPWKRTAEPYLPDMRLTPAAEDILNYLDRAIVRRRGSSRWASSGSSRMSMPLRPASLRDAAIRAREAHCTSRLIMVCPKKCPAGCPKLNVRGLSVRCYQRELPRLVRLGLLLTIDHDARNEKWYAPAWDPRLSEDPENVFRSAAARARAGMDTEAWWREHAPEFGEDPVGETDLVTRRKIEACTRRTHHDSAHCD